MNRRTPSLDELRDIAWTHWDPLDLKLIMPEAPLDEYDTYVLRATEMLLAGEDAAALQRYLAGVESLSMSHEQPNTSRIAATVAALFQAHRPN